MCGGPRFTEESSSVYTRKSPLTGDSGKIGVWFPVASGFQTLVKLCLALSESLGRLEAFLKVKLIPSVGL